MGKVIIDNFRTYIVLPKEKALLYTEFESDNSLRLPYELAYPVRIVAAKGVKASEEYFEVTYKGEGQLLFSVSSGFYRGRINPDEAHIVRKGLEKYLGETDGVNSSHESIRDVAQNIRAQISEAQRDNPYALTEGIVHWIKENIEYISLPKSLINHVGKTVKGLSGEVRTDAYKILRYSFNVKEDILRRMVENVYLPPSIKESSDNNIAKELMNQVNTVSYFFQIFWAGKEETSAQKTLEERAGKCVGISNLFVALSRNLGIPSRTVKGYAGNREGTFGGGHNWAVSYMQPYGWIEIDPTMHQFGDFDFDIHAYDFSMNHENLPGFTMIESNSDVSCGKIDDAAKLLENDRTWLDTLFRKKKTSIRH